VSAEKSLFCLLDCAQARLFWLPAHHLKGKVLEPGAVYGALAIGFIKK
jgi:hypothetical protein